MTPVRSSALALVPPSDARSEPGVATALEPSGRDRRAFPRLDPLELQEPLIARVKYGETVTLVDVSAGGAQFETSSALRPDSTLVLEMMSAGAQESVSVVSRVLRCHVSDVRGRITYRGACVFKRPLEHPSLIAPPPLTPVLDGFGRPEFALKAIVESYRRRVRTSRAAGVVPAHDASLVLESLVRLRAATEQRIDPIDRRLAQMLASIVPALERNHSSDEVVCEVLTELQRHIPALSIRVGPGSRPVTAGDAERITLNVWPEPDDRSTLTAEFPAGFDIDDSQLRLLKTGAYLLGLAESWTPAPDETSEAASALDVADAREPEAEPDLPTGWQRVVVRYADGELLRGYSNNFHPDAAHLHLSPEVNAPADERLLVPIARLKAVFFVRNLAGNAEHVDSNVFDHAPRARKVQVTFRDGEVMAGSTLNYKPDGQGFYLAPANTRGNNQRVFVVLAAVRHLRFM